MITEVKIDRYLSTSCNKLVAVFSVPVVSAGLCCGEVGPLLAVSIGPRLPRLPVIDKEQRRQTVCLCEPALHSHLFTHFPLILIAGVGMGNCEML